MSATNYVGPAAAEPEDVLNRLALRAQLDTASVSRSAVTGQISTAAEDYASKSYVDDQDATFVEPAFYTDRDALNIATSARGVANGVASLDSGTKIPLAQLPILGAGYLHGPFGPTSAVSASTSSTPVKFADWNIGVQSLAFVPWVFGHVLATGSVLGHPVVEVRISNGSAAYGSQTLIAAGSGRSGYSSLQSIAILPVPASTGQTPVNYSTGYNIWLSAYVYDLKGQSVSVGSTAFVNGGAFLMRGAL